MKRSLLLLGIMLAASTSLAWSSEKVSVKPSVVKKYPPAKNLKAVNQPQTPTALAETAPRQAAVATEPIASAPVAAPPAAPTVPAQGPLPPTTDTKAAPVVKSAMLIAPPKPSVLFAPVPPQAGNPYLQPVLVRPGVNTPPMVVVPVSEANPLEDLKSAIFSFLPDGAGRMHAPIFWELVKGPGKPMLLVQVSCPTKALIGVDTPVVAVLQLGVDQLIEMANDSNLLPAEIQKVCR